MCQEAAGGGVALVAARVQHRRGHLIVQVHHGVTVRHRDVGGAVTASAVQRQPSLEKGDGSSRE